MAAESGAASLGSWLLDSRVLVDVRIRCGERVWTVHKAVLCRKSAWFAAVFITGSRIERLQDGFVTIQEYTAEVMEAVIHWIYTDEIKDQNLDTENVVYTAYIDLFLAAKFFVIPDLIDACLLKLQLRLQKKAIKFQRALRPSLETNTPISDLVDEFGARGVMEGAKMACESNLETLKDLWLDFFDATMYWALHDHRAMRICVDHPSFFNKVMEKMIYERGITHDVFGGPPVPYCQICGVDPFVRRKGYFAEVWEEDPEEGPLGICHECGKTPRLFDARPYHLSHIDDFAMRVSLR